MHIFEANIPMPKRDEFEQYLPDLVDCVGLESFEDRLAVAADRAFDCAHLTAFNFYKDNAPRKMLMSAIDNQASVEEAGKRYSEVHWKRGPTNLFRDRSLEVGKYYWVLTSSNEVEDPDYLSDCYHETQIYYRASLLRRFPEYTMKLSFHRKRAAGEFLRGQLDDIQCYVDTILSLVRRHDIICAVPKSTDAARDAYTNKLIGQFPTLTERELQTCALICVGMTSEAIALTLGISINTVLTFRRRAYRKLNICSQNQLLRVLH